MSAGISIGGEVAWCSDGTLTWYLEEMVAEAGRLDPNDVMAHHLRDELECRGVGGILLLEAVLTDLARVQGFRHLFEVASRQIALGVATDRYATAYQKAYADEVVFLLDRAVWDFETRHRTTAVPVSDAPINPEPRRPRWTMFPGTTSRIVKIVETCRQRSRLPIEASLSLPLPWMEESRFGLAFFWASQGGPSSARFLSAPYCRTIVDPCRPTEMTFESLDPGSLGIPADAARLSPRVGVGLAAVDRKARRTQFEDLTDQVAVLFVNRADPSPIDVQATLASYRDAFEALSVIALRPAYRALSPQLFEWLELDW